MFDDVSAAFGILYNHLIMLNSSSKIQKRDAHMWLKSVKDGYGTFVWCCTHLSLDIGEARERLLTKNKKVLKEIIDAFEEEKESQSV